LGDLRAAERFGIATRIHPGNVHGHEPENLKRVFKQSLACLKTGKVEILFLVTRDSATPIESTLSAVQELHDEGLFEEFGVSNFSAWQVAEASEIAARRGWIRPSVYQGLYNAITRAVEPELFKCLGNYGIRFHAYDPLAGGAFSKSFGASDAVAVGSRFDISHVQGKLYHERYWNDAYLDSDRRRHQVIGTNRLGRFTVACTERADRAVANAFRERVAQAAQARVGSTVDLGDWSIRNWRPLAGLTSALLVALGGLAGSITDYNSYFPALGGPNGLLYDLTLKVAQPWRRNIPTVPAVFVAIDDASLSAPELAALPRALFQPVWARLIDGLLEAGARRIAFDVVFAYAGADFQVGSFTLPDYDRSLIDSLGRTRDRIILGRFPSVSPAPPFLRAVGASRVGVLDLQRTMAGPPPPNSCRRISRRGPGPRFQGSPGQSRTQVKLPISRISANQRDSTPTFIASCTIAK
jgi:Aldo/keto reductase family/CHASE2 domain